MDGKTILESAGWLLAGLGGREVSINIFRSFRSSKNGNGNGSNGNGNGNGITLSKIEQVAREQAEATVRDIKEAQAVLAAALARIETGVTDTAAGVKTLVSLTQTLTQALLQRGSRS